MEMTEHLKLVKNLIQGLPFSLVAFGFRPLEWAFLKEGTFIIHFSFASLLIVKELEMVRQNLMKF